MGGYNPWLANDRRPPDRLTFGLLLFMAALCPPLALVLGHVMLWQLKRRTGRSSPALVAVIVFGYLCLVFWIVAGLVPLFWIIRVL